MKSKISLPKAAADSRVELTRTLAILVGHEARLAEKESALARMEADDGADFINDDPDAVQRLGALTGEILVHRRAVKGAQRKARELAFVLAGGALEVERHLAQAAATNLEAAQASLQKHLTQYFAPEDLENAVNISRLVRLAAHGVSQRPSAVSVEPAARELHPDVTVQRVIDATAAVEAAVAKAESLAEEIRNFASE